MKLCASYHCKNPKLDEIRYPVNLLNNAIEFALQHTDKLIILEFLTIAQSNLTVDRLLKFSNEIPNLVYDCYELQDYIQLRQAHVPHVMYHYPITTYTNLWAVLQLSPHSVTIGEPLTFDLPKVRAIVDEYSTSIEIRVLPHIGRPANWLHLRKQDNGIRHFWITPQTLSLYSPYVNVIDLYDNNEQREDKLVQLYLDQDCIYNLNALLRHCESDIPCAMITDEIVQHRLTCKQRCMESEHNCHYCDRVEAVTHLSKPNHS